MKKSFVDVTLPFLAKNGVSVSLTLEEREGDRGEDRLAYKAWQALGDLLSRQKRSLLAGQESGFISAVVGLVPTGQSLTTRGSLLADALEAFPQLAEQAVAEMKEVFPLATKEVCQTLHFQTPDFIRPFEIELAAAIETGEPDVRMHAAWGLFVCNSELVLRFAGDSQPAVAMAAVGVQAASVPDAELGDLLERFLLLPDRVGGNYDALRDAVWVVLEGRSAEAALSLLSSRGRRDEAVAGLFSLLRQNRVFRFTEAQQERLIVLLLDLGFDEAGERTNCLIQLSLKQVQGCPSRLLAAFKENQNLNRSLISAAAHELGAGEVVESFADPRTAKIAAFAAYVQILGENRRRNSASRPSSLGPSFAPHLRAAFESGLEATRMYSAAALVLLRDSQMFLPALRSLTAAAEKQEEGAMGVLQSIIA